MGFQLIMLTIMGVLSLIWVLYCLLIRTVIASRKAHDNKMATMQCGKCGNQFDLPANKLPWMSKQSHVRVNTRGTYTLQRRVFCPACGKKRWSDTVSIEDADKIHETVMYALLKNVLLMVVGGAIIIAVTMIPVSIYKHFHKQKAYTYEELMNMTQEEREEAGYGDVRVYDGYSRFNHDSADEPTAAYGDRTSGDDIP